MSVLHSDRITILPLMLEQVELQLNDQAKLEIELGLINNYIEMDDSFRTEFKNALANYTIPKLKEHPLNYEWFTSWIIIHRADKAYIGSMGTGMMPNENGEVYFGYLVDKKYNGRGICTEAAKLYTRHLFTDPRLKQISATIPIGHIASEKVVQANGFTIDSQLEEEGMQLNKWVLRK